MIDITESRKLTRLGHYLYQRLGDINMFNPPDHGMYGVGTQVVIQALLDLYPYNPLVNFCHDYGTQGKISLKHLLAFFDHYVHDPNKASYRGNHPDNTVGKYPLIMDVVFSIYDIQCMIKDGLAFDINLVPLYRVDKEAYERIRPKRVAFTMLYLLGKNIQLKYGDYVELVYEVSFENNTKKYDAAMRFKKEKLYPWLQDRTSELYDGYTEINEKAHGEGNSNDILKKMIVDANGKVLRYYVIKKEIDELSHKKGTVEFDHTHAFIKDMMQLCKELLICYSDVFKVENLFAETQVMAQNHVYKYDKQITELKKVEPMDEQTKIIMEEKQDEMDLWIQMLENIEVNTDTLKKLYYYYEVGYKVNRAQEIEYGADVIDMDFIIKRLRFDVDKDTLGLSYKMVNGVRVEKTENAKEAERLLLKFGVRRRVREVYDTVSSMGDFKYLLLNRAEYDYFYDFNGFSSIIQSVKVERLRMLAQMNHRILLTVMDVMDYYTKTIAKFAHLKEEKRDAKFAELLVVQKKAFDKELAAARDKHKQQEKLLVEQIKERDIIIKTNFQLSTNLMDHYQTIETQKVVVQDLLQVGKEYFYDEHLKDIKGYIDYMHEFTGNRVSMEVLTTKYDTIQEKILIGVKDIVNHDPLGYASRDMCEQTKTLLSSVYKSQGVFKTKATVQNVLINIKDMMSEVYINYNKTLTAATNVIADTDQLLTKMSAFATLTDNKQVLDYIGTQKITDLEVVFEVDKSIVRGIPHLKLRYVEDHETYVQTEKAMAIIMSHGVSLQNTKRIIKHFYEVTRARSWDQPHLLVYLKIVNETDVAKEAIPKADDTSVITKMKVSQPDDDDSEEEEYCSDEE
jgi:hypothetical protein